MDIIFTMFMAAIVAGTSIGIDTYVQKRRDDKVYPNLDKHSRKELVKNGAGKFIPNPEELENGTEVTVYEKGTAGCWETTGFGWWEHGEICTEHGVKKVNVFDGTFEFDQVEVYRRKNFE